MSELLKWFEKRRETETLRMIQKHLAVTMAIAADLKKAVEAAVGNRKEEAKRFTSRVESGEKEADVLRRSVMDCLSQGVLSPTDREDLMHLTKRVDMVADWSREATRLIDIVPVNELSVKLGKAGVRMVEGIFNCTSALQKCIRLMMTKPEATMQAADDVERQEEAVDELHENVRRLLVSEEMRPGVAVLVHQFFESLEKIADACEDACDQVRVIVVRR